MCQTAQNQRGRETEELCVNELTGETCILELEDAKNYCLHERGARLDAGGLRISGYFSV